MAKAPQGLFGKIKGKVGNITLSSWKGIPYIKSQQQPYVSNTPAQQLQRKKFAIASNFTKVTRPVINAGYKWEIQNRSELNSATSYLLKWAFKGGLEDLALDYSKVLVARGDLPEAKNPQVQPTASGDLSFSWDFDEEQLLNRGGDKALILAYCPTLERAFYSVDEGITRKDRQCTLRLPKECEGRDLETYLAFTTKNGEEASNSSYLGKVLIM